MLAPVLLVVAAYLVGSLASAIIVCRAMGLPDPRRGGSGNPGATNVLRLGGRRAAAITLGADVLKGLLPVLAAAALGAGPPVLAAVACAAFGGHLFPVFFAFRGGKGVATGLGALAGLDWLLGALLVAVWLAVALVTRYSSLAALAAALVAPGIAMLRVGDPFVTGGVAIVSLLVIWRHTGNIRRLLDGTESKIGKAGPSADEGPG